MNISKTILLIFSIIGILSTSVFAAEKSIFYPTLPRWTPVEIMDYTFKALDYILKTGDFSEFQKKKGLFTKGKVLDYRFIFSVNCDTYTNITHAFIPQIVGKKGLLKNAKDANGRLLHRLTCSQVFKHPEGFWLVHNQIVPGTKQTASMVGFGKRIADTPYYVATIGREIEMTAEALNNLFREQNYAKRKKPIKSFLQQLQVSAEKAKQMAETALKIKLK